MRRLVPHFPIFSLFNILTQKVADKIPENFCETIATKLCGKWMSGGSFYHTASCIECVNQKEPELKAGGCTVAPKQLCADLGRDGQISSFSPMSNKKKGAKKMCTLSDWDDWKPCSRTCGVASKTRKRIPIKKGDFCPPLTETEPCNNDPCPWIPGKTCIKGSQYGAWSECSHICGPGGKMYRYRRETRCLAVNQFKPLTVKLRESKPCGKKYVNCTGTAYYQSAQPDTPPVSNSSKLMNQVKVDPKKPIIKMIGSNPIMIKKNQLNIFQDPGASCWSAFHTNKVKWGVNATGKVDMSVVGTYKITYTCYNAVPVTREVKVTELGCDFMEVNMGIFQAGIYEYTGKVHDGRPVYVDMKSNNSVLYYHGNAKWGEWAISHKLGDKRKLVKVEDSAIVPDDIVGTWHMW
jgi:hypothetical protein